MTWSDWEWLWMVLLYRADLWRSWEPGGEPAELDQRQPEPPDVHRTHWEIRSIQKPSGMKTINTKSKSKLCVCVIPTHIQLVPSPFSCAELFAGAEGDLWDGWEKQGGSVRGWLILFLFSSNEITAASSDASFPH